MYITRTYDSVGQMRAPKFLSHNSNMIVEAYEGQTQRSPWYTPRAAKIEEITVSWPEKSASRTFPSPSFPADALVMQVII